MKLISFIFTILLIFNIILTTNGALICCTGLGGRTFPCFFVINVADRTEFFKFLSAFDNDSLRGKMRMIYLTRGKSVKAYVNLYQLVDQNYKKVHFKKACELFNLKYKIGLKVKFFINYGKTPEEIQRNNQCSYVYRKKAG